MKTRFFTGLLAVITVVLAAVLLLRPRPPETPAPPPKNVDTKGSVTTADEPKNRPATADVSQSGRISLLGVVQSAAKATLTARMPARIVSVLVQEGDAVQKGQTLLQLDDADFRTQVQTANAGVAAAEAQYRKAIEGKNAQRLKADTDIATAQAGLKTAQTRLQQALLSRDAARADTEAERKLAQEGVHKAEEGLKRAKETQTALEELAKVGGVSRSDLEGARTQVKIAESDLTMAKTQAGRLEAGNGQPYKVALAQKDAEAAQDGVQQAQTGVKMALAARTQTLALADRDIQAAEAALRQARSGVGGAKEAQNSQRLVSPLDGIATGVMAKVGETAQPGVPLLTVVALSGLRVDALVTARQLSLLKVGQQATVSLETQPGKTLPAVVSEIARAAESDGRTFRVRLRFRDTTISLRPGQNARVEIAESAPSQ